VLEREDVNRYFSQGTR